MYFLENGVDTREPMATHGRILDSRLPCEFRTRRLTRDTNVLCPGFREYVPGPVDLRNVLRVDGNKNITFLKFPFVTLGDKLGYSLANEGAGDAADGSADCGPAQSGGDGSGSDERT